MNYVKNLNSDLIFDLTIKIDHRLNISLHEKLYFPIPGISWKAQKEQVNIFHQLFGSKKRPYFQSPQSSKQEPFSNQ